MLFLPGTLCTPAVFEFQIIELANVAPRIDVLRFTAQDSISKMACELVMLQDCGHFSILEQPDMVNDALRKWYLES